jgi:hypothetical protein
MLFHIKIREAIKKSVTDQPKAEAEEESEKGEKEKTSISITVEVNAEEKKTSTAQFSTLLEKVLKVNAVNINSDKTY